MAKRRRGGGTAAASPAPAPPKTTRQTRNSSKRKENKVNGIVEEVNNCDGNNGICDANKVEPIVHHKKFGTIRVEEGNNQETEETPPAPDSAVTENAVDEVQPPEHNNYTNDVMDMIANISGTKTRNSFRPSSSVYKVENDIPLDGSVIIKPGTFSSNTITTSFNVKSTAFYDANTAPNISSNFLKVIQSIEMLERNVTGSSPSYNNEMNDDKFIMDTTTPAFSEDVKIESEDFYTNSEPVVDNIKLEGDEDSETMSKCEDNNCKNMEISSPEDTMSSDVQEETINKKMENIVIDEGGDASNSPASNEIPDKKSQAFRNRTGSTDTTGSESSTTNGTTIRRSNRIRSIGIMKQKEREQAVKNEASAPGSPVAPPVPGFEDKPVKVKSRWRRSSELEMHGGKQSESGNTSPNCSSPVNVPQDLTSEPTVEDLKRLEKEKEEVQEGLSRFTALVENEYKMERSACKETKRMICDCVLTKEEIERGEEGCGEDCLNRMLFLECGPRCALGDRCTNKRFQKLQYANCKIFKTEKKGFGLRAEEDLKGNIFIMEYVGEVVDQKEFGRRVKAYAKENNKHFYFMALKGDAVIDATNKGNISRFINHSCDPNAETQKWTINGELRVGFFTKRFVPAGEEITFDYQFQRYGKEAQKCYCDAPSCRGWIGENPDDEEDDEEEEEDDEEESGEEEEEEVVEEEEEEEQKLKEEEEGVEGEGVKEEAKPIDVEKEKSPVKKEKSPKAARKRKVKEKKEEKVDDIGLEVEIQKLFQTGLKNRAHTLSLSRLMVRAEDWPTKFKLLQLIREGETPCRRLFLDYHGLRLICSWMVSQELEESSDRDERRLEILKTLAKLPIPNKNMLIDSKVLSVVEQWSKCGSLVRKLSVDEEGSDENKKPKEEPIPGLGGEIESSGMEVEVKSEEVSENSQKVRTMAESVLESWSSLKEVFKIPKKERIEQMKEHERQADRGYIEYLDNKENVRDKNGRYGGPNRYRNDRNRKRSRDSPPEPEWFMDNAKNRKLTKHERRQLFALKVLQEDEEAKKRMEVWKHHESRCMALGFDPNIHPAYDQSGFPINFDHNTGPWPSAGPSPHHPVPPSPICPSPMYSMGPPTPMCSNIPMNRPPVICRGGMMHNGHHLPPHLPPPNGPVTPTYHNVTPQYQPPIPQPIYEPLPVYQEPPEPIPAPYEEEQDDSVKPELMEVPINAPIKLPPKWKSAKDSLGRVYYYQVNDRISQWIPPAWTEEEARAEAMKAIAAEMDEDSSSSSESSSESSTEEEEEEEEEVNEEENEEEPENSISNNPTSSSNNEVNPDPEDEESLKNPDDGEAEMKDLEEGEIEDEKPESPIEDSKNDFEDEKDEDLSAWEDEEDIVKPKITEEKVEGQPAQPASAPQPSKGRRVGLVQEIIISPRREEDRVDTRKFKETKEMLRRQKEEERRKRGEKPSTRVSRSKKRRKEKATRNIRVKSEKTTAAAESSTDRKIKENFKNNMAGAIVSHLNPYRKQDCKIGRITNNEDFKHLARKLTHFVMLKELKHCRGVDDLECNDSVKSKAKDFIRKYMAKFGAVYQRPLNDNWKA